MTALEGGRSDRPPPGLARHFESFELNDVDKYYDATDEEEEDEFFPALSRATSESHLGQMLDALEDGEANGGELTSKDLKHPDPMSSALPGGKISRSGLVQDIAEARGNDPHLQLDVAGGPDFSIGALPAKAAPFRNHHHQQQQQHIQAGRSAAPGKGSASHPSPSQQEEAAGAISAAGARLQDADAKRSSSPMRKPAAGSASGAQFTAGATAASAGALAAALGIAARDQAAAAAAASTSKDDAAAGGEGAGEAGDDPPQTVYNSLATWLGFSRSSSASSISSRRASESSDAQTRVTAITAAAGGLETSFIMSALGNGSTTPLGVVLPIVPNPMSPEAQAAATAQFITAETAAAAQSPADAVQPSSVAEPAPAAAEPAIAAATSEAAAADPAAAVADAGGRRRLQQSTTVQDLLVLFTPAAASFAGGASTLAQWITGHVAMANKAYADSGISLQLRLTSIQQVSYSESGKSGGQVLDDLQAGRVPNAATLRAQTRSDLVTMFTTAPGCGLGYIAHNNANFRYSLIQNICMRPGYALAHEIGHNQGCTHNSVDNTNVAYQRWAVGWLRCDLGSKNFKTIMSYDCGPNRNQGVPELGQFARPEGRFNGVPTGDANNGNCARAIRETAATVAATQSGSAAPNTLVAGYCLPTRGCLTSPDGRFNLCMQTDANVVLYQGSTAIWFSRTQGRSTASPFRLCAETNGNLVAYDSRNTVLWASNTSGRGPANAVMQSNGNFVLYTASGQVIWSSGTCCR